MPEEDLRGSWQSFTQSCHLVVRQACMSWGILPCGPPQEDGLLESPLVKELMPGHPAKVLLSLLFWRQEEWNIMNPVSDSLLFIVLHIGLLHRVLLVETLVLTRKTSETTARESKTPELLCLLGTPPPPYLQTVCWQQRLGLCLPSSGNIPRRC